MLSHPTALHSEDHFIPEAVLLGRADKINRWYAVQCQPNRERLALHHLTSQGFSAFLPMREKMRRHARRIERVRVPLFPGYMFINLDLSRDRWRSVSGTVGVVRLVMQGDRPALVPQGVVEDLKGACDGNQVLRLRSELSPGEAIRVIIGPFAELIGELESMSEGGRLRVLLNIMGGKTPVFLPMDQVVGTASLL